MAINIPQGKGPAGRRLLGIAAPIAGTALGGPAGGAIGGIIGGKLANPGQQDTLSTLGSGMSGAAAGGGESGMAGVKTALGFGAKAKAATAAPGASAPAVSAPGTPANRRLEVASQNPDVVLQGGLDALTELGLPQQAREHYTDGIVRARMALRGSRGNYNA